MATHDYKHFTIAVAIPLSVLGKERLLGLQDVVIKCRLWTS